MRSKKLKLGESHISHYRVVQNKVYLAHACRAGGMYQLCRS